MTVNNLLLKMMRQMHIKNQTYKNNERVTNEFLCKTVLLVCVTVQVSVICSSVLYVTLLTCVDTRWLCVCVTVQVSVICGSVLYVTLLTCIDTESKPCSGRQVHTDSHGVITDGFGDYPASAHCEWLIRGKFLLKSSSSSSAGFRWWDLQFNEHCMALWAGEG